ncbi:MAG: dual specificity protein phosphatase family protein [Candidatus Latescibacteria bacterium]|nr:dual specificity protein phosphatase family protein [Candidatus Latescibacterota bacterium]
MIYNFSWLLPGQLGGAGQLGGWGYRPDGNQEQLTEDLIWLADQGVRALASLTEEPLAEGPVGQQGMRYLHLPIEDMQAPKVEEISTFIAFVDKALEEGRPVVVHCRAGLGRTGTMLACYLVHLVGDPRAALAEVRHCRPGSVETLAQELAVLEYAAHRRSSADWSNQVGMN